MRIIKSDDRMGPLLAAAFIVFLMFSALFRVSDVDVGYHMRTAQYILSGHGIPKTNTFSYTTPEEPWLLHQWLGTIIFYLPYRLAGVTGLIVFKALVATALMMAVWGSARRLCGADSIWPWWTVTLGTLIARVRFFERSDLLSALFCAWLFYLDIRFDRNRRWQWLGLPLLMGLWANVHAGVIYGFALLGALIAAEWTAWVWKCFSTGKHAAPSSNTLSPRELLVRPAGMVLALLFAIGTVQIINPNGWKVLWFPISQFSSKFWQAAILEYQRPDFAHYKLFYVSIGLIIVLQAITSRRTNLKLLFSTIGFAYLGCRSQRSILFFVIAAMPHLALMLTQALEKIKSPINLTRVNRVVLPSLWLALVLGVFFPDETFLFGTGFYHPYYPLEIYRFLEAEVPSQNLFNDMRYGGSMLWWLYPKFKPFIDGRGDAFTEQFWTTQYFPAIGAKPDCEAILKKHNVTGVLLPIYEDRSIPPLATKLHQDTNWALVAFNDETLLFLKRMPTNAPVIERCEFQQLWPCDLSLEPINASSTRSRACSEAQRAFQLSPESVYAQTALARAFFVSDKFAEAAAILRKFAAGRNVSGSYLRDFGYSLFRLGQLDEADRVFDRMYRQKFFPGFASYMRYFIANQKGQTAQARKFLTQAIKAEPTNPEYRQALNKASGN